MADRHIHDPLSEEGHPVKEYRTGIPASPPPESAPGAGAATGESRTLWGDAWRRLRRNKLAMAGLIWAILIILVVLSADLWVPQKYGDPELIDSTTVVSRMLLEPSAAHPFGTDRLGRDIFARVIYGARISLAVGVVAVAI